MSEPKFSPRAFCKIILHAAKYPHCAINGVLLAKSQTASSKEIEFVDAVPLFHICINLTPMAEIALMQIDEFASNKGLVIAGYYAANENLRDNTFEKAYHKIAEKISANYSPSYMVLINNAKLSTGANESSLKVAQLLSNGKFKPLEELTCSDGTSDVMSLLIQQKSFRDLVDFDNHLDDISLDWMNIKINKEIDSFLHEK